MLFDKSFFIIVYFTLITFFGVLLKYSLFLNDLLCIFCYDDKVQIVYDYIIVGSGSAGSVIANKLANNKNNKILVLEAGRYDPELLHIPSVGLLLQKTPLDWNYETVSQKNACWALNKNVSVWPMGKILGGTSMLNNMLYVRGHRQDFDNWFRDKENYDYSDILAYFKKLEYHASPEDKGATVAGAVIFITAWKLMEGHFVSGIILSEAPLTECILDVKDMEKSMYVQDIIFNTSLSSVLLKAAKSLGYPILINNINSKIGFSTPKANLHNGKRWTSASKLKLNLSPNLYIKTNRLVEKILFKSNYEAYGVKYDYFGKKYTARATKAVILSAGVVGTPKILMLSGIGRKDHLEKLGIKNIVDLPVGDNLQDHVTTGLEQDVYLKTGRIQNRVDTIQDVRKVLVWTNIFAIISEDKVTKILGFGLILLNKTLELGIKSMLSISSILKYFIAGKGPWTTTGCELMGFFNTKNNSLLDNNRPNLQFMVMPLGITEDDGVHLRKLMGISDKIWLDYFAKIHQPTMTILPVLLHPKSKGTVRLASSNPLDKPVIDPQYLTDPEDVDILISGIEMIKNLLNTKELASLGAKFNTNVFPACDSYIFDTKEYWECYIRHLTITSYHPVGTCKMGPFEDPSSVVDYNFKVKGTNKLFVCDGSVLPSLTSGNINAAILMMAEMASDIFKMIDNLSLKQCTIKDVFIVSSTC